MADLESRIYDVSLNIFKTNETNQLVGSVNPEVEDAGWQLDLTNLSSFNGLTSYKNLLDENNSRVNRDGLPSSRNHLYFNSVKNMSFDSLPLDLWQPGVGYKKDIEFKALTEVADYFVTKYLPNVNVGFYFIGSENHFLHSNYSVIQYPNIANDSTDSGVVYSSLDLTHIPDLSFPITSTIYKRSFDGRTIIWKRFKQTTKFLGQLSANTRANTVNNGETVWANIDNSYVNEFILNRTFSGGEATYSLLFNKSAKKEKVLPSYFATESLKNKILDHFTDVVGTSRGLACEYYETTYFPIHYIDSEDVVVYTYDPALEHTTTKTVWTVTDQLVDYFFADPTDKIVLLDKDLGIIRFNGYKPADTLLFNALESSSTSMYVLDASGFPDQGKLKLEESSGGNLEYITYTNKDGNILLNLTRGVDDTDPIAWGIDQPVEFIQSGAKPEEGYKVCVEYTAVPRVEYEPIFSIAESVDDLHKTRTNTITSLDLNPVKNNVSEGILYLHHDSNEVVSVEIEILNKEELSTDLYGSVYIGGDYANVKITAYNSRGYPVPNARLTVTLNSDLGNINGSSSITRRTGADGSFTVTYRTPSDPESLGAYSESVSVGSNTTTITFDDSINFSNFNLEDVYLFQVTKDEPHLGSIGYKTSNVGAVEDSPITSVLNGALVVNDLPLEEGYFNDGLVYIEYASGNVISRTIKRFSVGWSGMTGYYSSPSNIEESLHNENVRVLHFTEAISAGTISSVRLVESDATEWSSTLKNGRKSIVYRLEDQDALTHPSMNLDTVYGPLRPVSGGANILNYEGVLPIPSATSNDNLLGAYWSYAPQKVTLSVSKSDNLCGSGIIELDSIGLLVALPPSMLGVYVSGNLKVPYGFRILSDTFGAASTLNTATFLTINNVGRFGSEGPFISTPSGETLTYGDSVDTGIPSISVRITIT